jgi:hypothetical protein
MPGFSSNSNKNRIGLRVLGRRGCIVCESYNERCCIGNATQTLAYEKCPNGIECCVDDHTRHITQKNCFGFTAPLTNKNNTDPSLQFILVLLDPATQLILARRRDSLQILHFLPDEVGGSKVQTEDLDRKTLQNSNILVRQEVALNTRR